MNIGSVFGTEFIISFEILNQVHPPESDPKDPAQPNRFNAVIEKIERLYMVRNIWCYYQRGNSFLLSIMHTKSAYLCLHPFTMPGQK